MSPFFLEPVIKELSAAASSDAFATADIASVFPIADSSNVDISNPLSILCSCPKNVPALPYKPLAVCLVNPAFLNLLTLQFNYIV